MVSSNCTRSLARNAAATARLNSRQSLRSRKLLQAGVSLGALLLASPAVAGGKWDPSLDVIGQVGSNQSGGALDLMIPLYQDDDTLLFGNALGGLDSDSSIGTAVGVGLRLQIDESYILGGYVFGDWLRSENNNAFFQATGGLELMTTDWDLRVTGYLPLTSERLVSGRSASNGVDGVQGQPGVGTGVLAIQDDELGILWEGQAGSLGANGFKNQEALLAGFEGEVGYKLPLDKALGKNWEVRTYLGGYHFSADNYDTFAGPRARVELRGYDLAFLGDGARITLGAEASWDDPRGVTGAGLLRVRIPLGWFTNERKELTPLDRRMVDPIPRRITPFTDQRHEVLTATGGGAPGGNFFEAVESPQTGNDETTAHEIAKVYFASGTGSGHGATGDSGFVADPTDLDSAVTRAGVGGLIVVLGGEGILQAPVAGVELQQNQIVIGGDTTIQVRGVTSSQAFTFDPGDFSTSASRPTINSNIASGSFGVTIGTSQAAHSGTWIQGINMTLGAVADVRIGIFHEDSSNHLVRDVDVTGGEIAFGVDTASMGGVLADVVFDDVTSDGSDVGFYAQRNTGTGTLSNITLTNATFSNEPTGGVIVTPIQIASAEDGLLTDVTLENVTVTGSRGSAIVLSNVRDVSITNTSVTSVAGNVGSGLGVFAAINDNNQNISVSGFSATGFGIGLNLREVKDSTFDDVTLTDGTQLGIEMVGNNNVAISNTDVIGTGTAMAGSDIGVRITDSTGVTITNVAIDGHTSGGTQVTDQGFVIQAISSVTFNASTGNTTTNIPDPNDCIVVFPANVTGSLSYDDLDNGAGAVTCPP